MITKMFYRRRYVKLCLKGQHKRSVKIAEKIIYKQEFILNKRKFEMYLYFVNNNTIGKTKLSALT